METSPSETSGDSLPKTDSAVSASCARRVRGKRAARDAALGPLHEEEASQFSRGEPPAKRRAHGLSERCSAKANDLSSCSFLRNLWEVTESDRFQSIWWGDEGDFIVIEEPFFRTEVLARRGPHKLFSFESMTTFVRHLHHHGFFITEADLASCASRARLQGEGAAFSTCSELLCYYHPYFKRVPALLKTHSVSVGIGKGRSAASSLEVQPGPAASVGTELPVSIQDAAPAASPNHATSPGADGPFPLGLGADSGAAGDGAGSEYKCCSRKHSGLE
ncbi:hypothetical protein ASZ78_016906 [Callipepla squamata]|uniref:HSF-type DNA-binding domain-containing protein n=2 Tax=Callipepla squamata TaxID=9009 RepID=A0A226MA15_CALSU|nr:hypothetical protein ASZ78_016906 [Callipepla squamata]